MAESEIPTLASLRRAYAPRRRSAVPESPLDQTPSLFDVFTTPPPAAEAAEHALAEAAARPQTPAQPSPVSPLGSAAPSSAPQTPAAPHLLAPGVAAYPTSVTPPATRSVSAPAPAPAAVSGPAQAPQTWSVSGLVRHVRGLVEGGYAHVTVEGEISNWRPAGSGHCYFTVKDAGAQLSAVLFRRQAALLRFQPRDGDAVKLHGQLSVYENRGQLQLIVEWMQQAGLGAMLAAVQALKEALRREGLFDRKRPLPAFPRCIGVITSLQGAALRDIVKVCRRRHAAVRLLIYPAAVQGPNCPGEIAAGLRWFNAHPDQAEVVLVARGGGSWEDLHGFDHESVVRAIAASTLPVITGIGHATDSTIADAAADTCAPTPSAAAEILTAAQHRVEDHVERLHSRLLRAGRFELLRAQQRLARLGANTVLRRVEDVLNRRAQRLDELSFRSEGALNHCLRSRMNRFKAAEARLHRLNPVLRLQADRRRLQALQTRLERVAASRLLAPQRRLDAARTRLETLSPLRVLERGYALVYGPDGHLLLDPQGAVPGQTVSARLAKGTVRAEVLP